MISYVFYLNKCLSLFFSFGKLREFWTEENEVPLKILEYIFWMFLVHFIFAAFYITMLCQMD